ncbi:MAG: anaerobic ribonucleoside triphosphate reductase [Oscillospiraceae bacterium]|nr:anaerobic ribonucleoside triphosphate reductase [Oscillospiraceae bacterium]
MITTIIKRDGRFAPFDIDKITQAIYKAASAVGGQDLDTAEALAEEVEVYLADALELVTPTVEQIQDAVEKILIENGHARTAKEFILYRDRRTKVRNMNSKLMKTLEDLTFKPAIENDIKRENANIDGDTAMGTMLKYGSESAKQFYEMFLLQPEHSAAHNDGDIHIHDLDFLALTTTCCQIDIDALFRNGFCTGHGFLREPSYIASYSALACIAIQSNQNDQHGGQSVPNFDYGLAKGVAKSYKYNYRKNLSKALELLADRNDAEEASKQLLEGLSPSLDNRDFDAELSGRLSGIVPDEKTTAKILRFAARCAGEETDRDTYKAMVALVHNLNTMHSRAGAQIPFSSLNYGTDVSPEGRMVVKNLLLATEAGLGNSETPIFPIQIFKVKEGVNYNPEDPNYDLFKLACRVSAKRLFPNFSFLDAPFNKQYYVEGRPETEVAYMGCRTRVIANIDKSRETTYGRGNLSFTSINLPRIAIKSHGSAEFFFEELDRKINIVTEQLLDRFKIQCSKKVRNFPFLMGQGIWMGSGELGPDDSIAEVLRHGTLTVGFIGLAECLTALIGKHHGESREAQNLGLEIIGFMRQRIDKACEKHKLNFSLIATPAEGLSGRFVKIDKKNYGIIPGVTDREYYTNSFHIPVYYEISAHDKIRLEAPYHALTNGGHISYIELDGDPSKNTEAFERIVHCMKEAGMGYGSINHPVDRDPVCGYTGIIGESCPKCGRREGDGKPDFERIRRITGYLVGTLDHFNNGKRAEERDRVKHFNIECANPLG